MSSFLMAALRWTIRNVGACASLSCMCGVAPATAAVDVLYVHGTHPPALAGETLRLNDTGGLGYSRFRMALEEVGFRLDEFEAGPASTAQLTEALLANYQVIILSSNNRVFSAAEASAVNGWVHNGGGLVAWSDAAFGRDQDGDGQPDANSAANNTGIPNTIGLDSDNSLTAQFGMQLLRDSANGVYDAGVSRGDYQFGHFLGRNDPTDGVVHFEGEGVSPIKVSGAARVLIRFTDTLRNDGSQNPALNPADVDDGIILDNSIAALAIAEVGQGRVVGTFDRNTFFNPPGAGTNIDQHDNKTFAQNLVLWSAHAEQLALPGDYNGNSVVDGADYVIWRDMFGQLVTPFSRADGNGNGAIDAGDYDVWRAQFGATTGGPGAANGSVGASPSHLAAPEPNGLLLCCIGGGVLVVAASRAHDFCGRRLRRR